MRVGPAASLEESPQQSRPGVRYPTKSRTPDLLNNSNVTKYYNNDVYLLPKELDEKLARVLMRPVGFQGFIYMYIYIYIYPSDAADPVI